ncbi:MAG: twin-arginine translocase subunit TatC [Eubacteriales bacterium]|nr:twin-arginine translocase subunit TatC [Eubacteriales bacterium]
MPKIRPFKKKPGQKNAGKEMTLSGHLREMRNRILVCVILLTASMLISLNFAPQLVTLLLDIGKAYSYRFVYISPQELLLQYFSVSLTMGICVTLPMLFYQVWAFVKPGLKKGENLLFLFAMIFGLICFCIGICFAYWIMLPFMLSFLISLSNGSGVEASISVQNYISFLITIFMIFGLVFELPIVSVLLSQMGLLKVKWMKAGRKAVIVVIFFVAAVITPPDVVSQVMVAIPMIVLYEFSIVLCSMCEKLKRKKKK